jgi:gluconokinase
VPHEVSGGTRDLSPVWFRLVVVMGVSGSGKSTIASMLAAHLGWVFLDGDWLHPPANVEKMRGGTPLTDEDRWPWLRAIADQVAQLDAKGSGAVVACSALKRAYRDALMGEKRRGTLVYLQGDLATVSGRLHSRGGHFMPPALLASQFETLEEPDPDEQPIVVSIDRAPGAIVDAIVTSLGSRAA